MLLRGEDFPRRNARSSPNLEVHRPTIHTSSNRTKAATLLHVQKERVKINFLSSVAEKKARRTTLVIAGFFTLLVGVLSAIGAGASYQAASRGVSVLSEVGHFFSFGSLNAFSWVAPSDGQDPFNTPDGKINILLLGIGGAGHDGAQLTDTILYSSFDTQQGKLGLVSIPRDLAYPLGGNRFEKINSVNAYEESAHPGEGAQLTSDDFSKLFTTRIDRVVKIDFKGFEEFVDALGGIDVNVEKSFTDYQYPTNDDGPNPNEWMTVSFKAGVQHLTGARALEFARSRHAEGSEGSDFARSRRQQLVIQAVRDRLLSLGTLTNPKKISDLWTALSSHIQTDFTAWDMLKLVPYVTKFSDLKVTSHVFTDAPDGGLIAANVNGAYMLFPRKADWSEIRNIIANPFDSATSTAIKASSGSSLGTFEPWSTSKKIATSTSLTTPPKTSTTSTASVTSTTQTAKPIDTGVTTPIGIISNDVTVEVRNGTSHTGFASQISNLLKKQGYSISTTGNAPVRNFDTTVVYDLTNGLKSDELATLKKLLHADVASVDDNNRVVFEDGTSENVSASSAQFLIILGNSSLNLVSQP